MKTTWLGASSWRTQPPYGSGSHCSAERTDRSRAVHQMMKGCIAQDKARLQVRLPCDRICGITHTSICFLYGAPSLLDQVTDRLLSDNDRLTGNSMLGI